MSLTKAFFDRMLYFIDKGIIEVKTVRNADATRVCGFIDSQAWELIEQLNSGVLNSEYSNYFTKSNLFSLYVQSGGLGEAGFKVLTQDFDYRGNLRESEVLSVEQFQERYKRQSTMDSKKWFRENQVYYSAQVPEWLVIGTLQLEDVPMNFGGGLTPVKAGDKVLFPYDGRSFEEVLEQIKEDGFENTYWGVGSGQSYRNCDKDGNFNLDAIYEFYEQDDEPGNNY